MRAQTAIKSECVVVESADYDELKYIQFLSKARNLHDMQSLIIQQIRKLGFKDFSFIRVNGLDDIQVYFLNTNLEVQRYYAGEGIWEHDLMLQYAASNTKCIFQSTIDRVVATAPFDSEIIVKNRNLQTVVKGNGYHEHFNIPITAANGQGNVMLSLTTRGADAAIIRKAANKNTASLVALCRAIDHVTTHHLAAELRIDHSDLHIHAGPLRLLVAMLEEDLNMTEAAKYIGIAPSTARKHMTQIRELLGADTNHTAIYRALEWGLITLTK